MRDILVVNNATKQFGGLTAVKDVSFSVQEGMRLGIIGPNGAGKTTMFNMITGEYKPTSGKIEFGGEEIQGLKPHNVAKRGIGRTFQIVRVFEDLTVLDNILMGILAQKLRFRPAEEQIYEADEIIKTTNLQKYRDVLGKHLTVSAKKRVGLATALALKPKMLLLDEVMAGLTHVEIGDALQLLRKINSEMGITLVIVEHVMKVVMELCEKIVVLSFGEKIAEGSPQEITQNRKVIDVYLGESKHA
ncbi:MAG: ABC transporter ATP-binding protein [Parachlamydia sp.]|nr:ABC transporter ATP-binding protein [Parachlamydia sp.]